MVATRSTRAVARGAAILLTLLMIVPTLPPAAAQTEGLQDQAEQQTQQLGTIHLRQGTGEFFQSGLGGGNTPTQFITGDNTATTLRVPVYNTGAGANNVPVYFWFADTGQEGVPARSGCTTVNVPAFQPSSTTGRTASSVLANWTFTTGDLVTRGYNITVQVGGTTKPPQVTQNCPGASPPNVDTLNDQVNTYFVKGAKIDLTITDVRWCKGRESAATCVQVSTDPDWNLSRDVNRFTFFEFDVVNAGTWANLSDFGGPCKCETDGLRVPLNVSLTGAFLASPLYATNLTASAFQPRSMAWNMRNFAGTYNATATLDPIGALRGAIPQDVTKRDVEIGFRDFTATIQPDGLKTSASDPYTGTSFQLKGTVLFENRGRQDFDNTALGADGNLDLKWRIYVVNASKAFDMAARFNMSGSNDTFAGFHNWTQTFDWSVSTTPGDADYLAPGKHTIRAEIDSINGDSSSDTFGENGNVTFELDDWVNNNHTIDIYIGGGGGPSFRTDVPKLTVAPATIDGPTATALRPYEMFNLFANITHADVAHLTVTANFTRADDESIYRVETMESAHPFGVEYFVLQVPDFNATNGTAGEDWKVRVTATDVFGRSANSSYATFKLVPWGIETASRDYVVQQKPDTQDITWSSTDQPTWIIRVKPNATGVADQRTNVTNLGFDITTPKNRTYSSEGAWTPVPVVCTDPLLGNEVCPQEDEDRFRTTFSKGADDGGPGTWNYTIRIRDRANITHSFNGTFRILDELPEIKETRFSPSEANPGQNITVRVNATDDFSVKAAYVNFTRTTPNDGYVVNITLPPAEIAPDTLPAVHMFNDTIKTGRGERFGVAGTYSAKLWVVDENDNWNWSALGSFTLNDTDTPTLVEAAATPSVQELGENVTFTARVRDTTNVTVKLQVLRLSEEVFPAVTMVEGADGAFSHTVNFSTEDTFDWVMTATDSAGRASEVKRGTLTIRSNVGPRFEIRAPNARVEAERFGSATPRIEVLVHDTEGVLPATIEMQVGGVLVQPDIVNATGSQGGYIVSYTVPAAKKFSHRDEVEVNLTAIDNSTEHYPNWLNFSFTVDDVAPVARIVGITPSYRDQPSQPLNISLASRITLAADDNDGLATGVESIRFRILGGGNNAAETVYSGPFRITDAPGVYTGPRLYQIQFWAEDSVGNFNRNFNVTTVFVDDTPPALFQFFPQGRQINATFVDDRVGVNRSVAWYRVNNDPFVPLPLAENAGEWSTMLPEGKKGDRISYYLQVWDRLENTDTFGNQTAPYASFDVSNHEPKVRIKTPTDGARLGRTVDLLWEASDEDNDALVFTLYYKAPGRQNFVELARLENSDARRYAIDTLRFPDGQYTLRVAASDGGFVKLSDVTVTILNRGSAVGAVSVDGGTLPGESALVTAEITKAQATVEARIYLDGQFVDAFPMNDEGVEGDAEAGDGIYSATVPISAAGDYSVEIFSRYQEDGELKESTMAEAATFSAKLTPGYILSEYAAILALIAVLAAVGIGVAIFVVMRRR